MNEEDKELLLKYLCMALPYGVKVVDLDGCVFTVKGIDGNSPLADEYSRFGNTYHTVGYGWKPYLRPMSSMTEEETDEYWDNINLKCPEMPVGEIPSIENIGKCSTIVLNWLLENHFDFMGLIPKDLAIEVTEDNNPYKNYNYD